MEITTEICTKKLSELKPSEYNPREMTETAAIGLGQSLERFGLLAHIVWNKKTGNIVGGHQRYKQLQDRGIEETDVIVVDLSDTEEMALNIALNSRTIKGDFTIGAIEALRMTEARIGQVFQDIKLDDLLQELEKKNKKKKEKKPKSQEYEDAEPISMSIEQAEAIINCPKCGSKWKMKDNTVIENNFKPSESPNEQQTEI